MATYDLIDLFYIYLETKLTAEAIEGIHFTAIILSQLTQILGP